MSVHRKSVVFMGRDTMSFYTSAAKWIDVHNRIRHIWESMAKAVCDHLRYFVSLV